ncbi:MAG: DUF4342 domain-containing protein [Eubacterium sp.]|nr:DUF4342 domain-containing protein [Eubacterium sp.]
MDKIKQAFRYVFASRLVLFSNGRTMLKLPLWLAVIAGLDSLRFVILAALVIIALGFQVSVEKG